jgi:dTDP-D-glucose 4,6-dehydratase
LDAEAKTEQSPLSPTNPYAASKAACESMLNAYCMSYRLPAIVLRMNNVYGPRQFESKVVPKFIMCAINGHSMPIAGDGRQVRAWMYVEDACTGIRMCTQRARVGGLLSDSHIK